MDSATNGSEAALRVLGGAGDDVIALRDGTLLPETARGHILRLSNAIDRSLRRLLRDDESAEMSVRLKALAPDELRVDSVLAELRRNDRLPMDLAASIHELLELRRRLEQGASPTSDDTIRTIRVVDRLTKELRAPSARVIRPAPAVAAAPVDEPLEVEATDTAAKPRLPRRIALIAVVLGGLIGIIAVFFLTRGPDPMEQGIALFRSGDFEESARYFWRASEADPEDPTPHLYLARVHRRTNRLELAADAIRQAQALAPEDAAVHRETGFLLLDTGRPDVAVDRFRQAISLDRESSEGWVGLARALRESGRGAEVPATIADAPAEVRALLNQPATN